MQVLDLATWPGAAQFQYFRTFDRPHYAMTTRVPATRLKTTAGSTFRNALWAMGAGLAAVPALRLRFTDDTVVQHDDVQISLPIALDDGTFGYGYFDWQADRVAFDAHAKDEIARVTGHGALDPVSGKPSVCYASCLPWLDFTALDNALPGPADCVPRIAWGKIVPKGAEYDMALSLQVHHALVAGRDVAAFFDAVAAALEQLEDL